MCDKIGMNGSTVETDMICHPVAGIPFPPPHKNGHDISDISKSGSYDISMSISNEICMWCSKDDVWNVFNIYTSAHKGIQPASPHDLKMTGWSVRRLVNGHDQSLWYLGINSKKRNTCKIRMTNIQNSKTNYGEKSWWKKADTMKCCLFVCLFLIFSVCFSFLVFVDRSFPAVDHAFWPLDKEPMKCLYTMCCKICAIFAGGCVSNISMQPPCSGSHPYVVWNDDIYHMQLVKIPGICVCSWLDQFDVQNNKKTIGIFSWYAMGKRHMTKFTKAVFFLCPSLWNHR